MASALLIGVGAGWMLFGRDAGPAMDAKQQQAWTEFEASGNYDAGSIRMLGEKYGITAWYATKSKGDLECVMLTPSPEGTEGCGLRPDPESGEDPNFSETGAQLPLDDAENSVVQAYLARDARGEPVIIMQKWGMTREDDWTANFQGAELDMAKVIVDQTGLEGMYLRIVGYDGDTPIWYEDASNCLLVADATEVLGKDCLLQDDIHGTRLTMPGVTYELRNTQNGQFLTVIRGSDPDGPSIDDTTGEITE